MTVWVLYYFLNGLPFYPMERGPEVFESLHVCQIVGEILVSDFNNHVTFTCCPEMKL